MIEFRLRYIRANYHVSVWDKFLFDEFIKAEDSHNEEMKEAILEKVLEISKDDLKMTRSIP